MFAHECVYLCGICDLYVCWQLSSYIYVCVCVCVSFYVLRVRMKYMSAWTRDLSQLCLVTYAYIRVDVCVRMYVPTCTYMCVFVGDTGHVWMYVCVSMNVYLNVYVYYFVHVWMQASPVSMYRLYVRILRVHICACVCKRAHVRMYVSMSVYSCVLLFFIIYCINVCMSVCVYQ